MITAHRDDMFVASSERCLAEQRSKRPAFIVWCRGWATRVVVERWQEINNEGLTDETFLKAGV